MYLKYLLQSLIYILLGGIALGSFAQSASYPKHPTKIIVPFAPGGPTDVQARWAAQQLNEEFNQAFIVDNKAGAGGVIGVDAVVKSPADGYTLLAGNPGPLTVAPAVKNNLPFKTLQDLVPIFLLARTASCISVHPSVPTNNVKEFISYARANPDKLNYGTPGVGTVGHLSLAYFANLAGVKINHVPYKGTSQYLNDLSANIIQIAQIQLSTCIPMLKAGKIRVLGVTSETRSRFLPDVPTIAEQGLTGYQSYNWNGLLAPANTPKTIVNKIHEVLTKKLMQKENQELFLSQGFELMYLSPDEYGTFIRLEMEKWEKIAKAADIHE
jgi:tripartite-type tricarboxylate transporter receptor subunit TctC